MTIAKTMTNRDVKLVPPAGLTPEQKAKWDAAYGPKIKAFQEANLQGKDLVRWKYQRYMHDYLACIASVDDSVGRVLDYLQESGQADNTIVVYTSDQGFYLGEHGWFDKRFMYEESLQMPLVVRYPKEIKAGVVNKDIVMNLDFAETFLDYAGARVPEDMQGVSLRPVLQGRTPGDWRTAMYYHYYEYPAVHSVKRHYGIRTERYKLIHFYNDIDEWELYDLKTDPGRDAQRLQRPCLRGYGQAVDGSVEGASRQVQGHDRRTGLKSTADMSPAAQEPSLARAPALDDLVLTVVHDNYPCVDSLKTAWGFSALVTGAEKTILFDTGCDGTLLLENMASLQIDPAGSTSWSFPTCTRITPAG